MGAQRERGTKNLKTLICLLAVWMCALVHTYTPSNAVHTRAHTRTHIRTGTRTHTHVHTHVHIHTHTHTHTRRTPQIETSAGAVNPWRALGGAKYTSAADVGLGVGDGQH